MNIDQVITPYADSQPNNLSVQSTNIERIPRLVDVRTGQVTEEFQKFFDSVVQAITNSNISSLYLYKLTSEELDYEDFNNMCKHTIYDDTWNKFLNADNNKKGLDIELNLSEFESTFRNLIGSFYVMFYLVESEPHSILDYNKIVIKRYRTKIFFTYRDNSFRVIPEFSPFYEKGPMT